MLRGTTDIEGSESHAYSIADVAKVTLHDYMTKNKLSVLKKIPIYQ